MRKVLFIIPSFEVGGTNTSLLSIINAIKDECDLSVFAISNTGEFKDKFTGTRQINSCKALSLWYGNFNEMGVKDKVFASLIKGFKRLAVFFNLDIENIILKYTAKAKRLSEYDTVVGFQEGNATALASFIPAKNHISWIHCNLKYSNINYKKYINSYGISDNVVCVSKSGQQAFDEIYPNFRHKSTVIYNLINRNKIINLSTAIDNDVVSIPKNTYTILSVGRFHPIKQFSKIPEIAFKIKRYHCNFQWLIAGDGDESEKQAIKHEIQKYGVEKEVTLVGFKDNPYPLFAKADLYVCTSLSEACPMVFLEANVLDTPVVSNDFPSAHELISNSTGSICSLVEMHRVIIGYIGNRCTRHIYNSSFQKDSFNQLTALLC